MAKHDEVLTFTSTELQSLMASTAEAAVKAAMAAVLPQQAPQTFDEKRAAFDKELRLAYHLQQRPQGPASQRIPCAFPSGAKGTCIVAPSETYPEGRIVGIEDYEHPPGVDALQKDGGLVPQGVHQKEWKWANYWQRDLRAYVGQRANVLLGQTVALAPIGEMTAA
jgi:hypothetical protein